MERPMVGVAGIVVEDGRVLVVRRAKQPAAGYWTFPGGHLEMGESLAEGLRRELHEECCIEVEVGPLVDVVELIREDEGVAYHYIVLDYLAWRVAGVAAPADDADALEWVTLDELDALMTTPRTTELAAAALRLASTRG